MKKLMKLGTIAVETRTQHSGNFRDGDNKRLSLGQCIWPQSADGVNPTFTDVTTGC